MPMAGRNSKKFIKSQCSCISYTISHKWALQRRSIVSASIVSASILYSQYTEALTSVAGGWLQSALRSCPQVMLSKGDWSVRPGDGEGDFCEALDMLVQHIVNHCAALCAPTPVPKVCICQVHVLDVKLVVKIVTIVGNTAVYS